MFPSDTFLSETSPFSVPTVREYLKNLTKQILVFIYRRKKCMCNICHLRNTITNKISPNSENRSTKTEEKENNVIIE